MMKKKLLISMAFMIILIVIVFLIFKEKNVYSGDIYNGLPVNYTDAVYAFDTSNPKIAVGVSKYVAVVKVNSILRTEYRNPLEIEIDLNRTKIVYDPCTVYSISVIRNIKGNLISSEPIEIMQFGGLNYDGKSYTFLEGGSLLNVGDEYILMANAMTDGGDIEVADPNRIIPLSSVSLEGKNSNNYYDDIINKYILAYQNEIIPTKEDTGGIEVVYHISKYDENYSE